MSKADQYDVEEASRKAAPASSKRGSSSWEVPTLVRRGSLAALCIVLLVGWPVVVIPAGHQVRRSEGGIGLLRRASEV